MIENKGNNVQEQRIRERLEQLRALMKEEHMDYWIIPTGDDHQSEYISDHFKTREYMSGFTGSAGTLLVSADMAGLWTDGRYFVQAEHELAGSGIELFRMQEAGVLTLEGYLAAHVRDGDRLGFDGRIVSASFRERLKESIKQNVVYCTERDLVGRIWTDRPKRPAERIYPLSDALTGRGSGEKVSDLRAKMREYGADAFLLSTLDDIMWLFNLRGNDVSYNPVGLSFAYITLTAAFLFADAGAFDEDALEYLARQRITLRTYDEIYGFLREQSGQTPSKLLLDKSAVSLALYEAAGCGHEIADVSNHLLIPKAVKNRIETELCRSCHLADAVAVTKFIYWLKNHPDITTETELSVSRRLEEFRKGQAGYTEPSFETIAAYGSNAAMIHYTAGEDTDTRLGKKGMLLVDSGGQYMGATTDITRTIVLGPLTMEQKRQYTAVVCGMLKLADAVFLYGCTGRNLDILAREPLWKLGLDYRHGTGHGVGSFLSVHEGPQAFRWKSSETQPETMLEPGMIITDEPGIYIEGSHGIRIENELLCVEKYSNEWGRYLGFETLTQVPIDLEAIVPEYMSDDEKNLLNVYHRKVYETLCPHLTDNEAKWLCQQTFQI